MTDHSSCSGQNKCQSHSHQNLRVNALKTQKLAMIFCWILATCARNFHGVAHVGRNVERSTDPPVRAFQTSDQPRVSSTLHTTAGVDRPRMLQTKTASTLDATREAKQIRTCKSCCNNSLVHTAHQATGNTMSGAQMEPGSSYWRRFLRRLCGGCG